MSDPIRFYPKAAAYQEPSNFAPFGFEDDAWSTVAHYFQAQKFPGPENAACREKIRAAKTPKQAKALGRTRAIAFRPDSDDLKESIMLGAAQEVRGDAPREMLLATGDRLLIEAPPFGSYWVREF